MSRILLNKKRDDYVASTFVIYDDGRIDELRKHYSLTTAARAFADIAYTYYNSNRWRIQTKDRTGRVLWDTGRFCDVGHMSLKQLKAISARRVARPVL